MKARRLEGRSYPRKAQYDVSASTCTYRRDRSVCLSLSVTPLHAARAIDPAVGMHHGSSAVVGRRRRRQLLQQPLVAFQCTGRGRELGAADRGARRAALALGASSCRRTRPEQRRGQARVPLRLYATRHRLIPPARPDQLASHS